MIELAFSKDSKGLLPAIVQDYQSCGSTDACSHQCIGLGKTLENRQGPLLEPFAQQPVAKGELSGHVQRSRKFWVDCDADTVVYKVEQLGGAACHTGYRSCFYSQSEW